LLHCESMTKEKSPGKKEHSVVTTVFEDFLTTLENDSAVEKSVVQRLRRTLIENRDLSSDALKQALFVEEPLP